MPFIYLFFLAWLLSPLHMFFCLVPDLSEKTLSFTIEYDVCCGFFIYSFSYAEIVSFYSNLLSVFVIKGFWHFLHVLFFIKWDDHVSFFLHSVNVVYYTDQICLPYHPCILEINCTWSWCIFLLLCCWILFASILWRVFASNIKGYLW